jgi:ATP-binding cassette subfamily F protein 3
MPLISWSGVERHFGATEVLRGASGAVEPGQKVALVGPNGAGKTTLLRILVAATGAPAGERPDGGTVALQRGATVGYLPQRPEPPPGKSLRDWVMEAFAPLFTIEAELAAAHEALARARGAEAEQLLERADKLQHELERRGGYHTDRRAEAVLTGLGFRAEQLEMEAARLSGGEKSRGALARLLCEEPDLLLLDEPTNHLDIDMIEWLEGWLAAAPEAAIVVSHDRYFLDRVATKVFALERGKTEEYEGNYSAYCLQRDERALRAAKERAQHRAFVEKEREFIRRFRAGQRAREAAGREKRLERLIAEIGESGREGPETSSGKLLAFDFGATRRSGDEVLRVRKLSHRFGDGPPLFDIEELDVRRGDRIGVIGPNGSGKTTFLRLLAGESPPRTGVVKLGASLDVGYYRQEGEDLDPAKTVLEELHDAAPREDLVVIRGVCGRFGFTDDEQLKRIGTLSGGERARVSLAKLFLRRPNLLLLDEPTNHLDLEAREALEGALDEYRGTIIAVSHDRYFLDRTATKILAFGARSPRLSVGDYTAFRERREAEAREARRLAAEREKAGKERQRKAAPAPAAGPAPRPEKRAGARPKKKHTFEELEKKIVAAEARAKELEAALVSPANARDFAKLNAIAAGLESAQAELRELNAEWDLWAEELS